MSLRDPGAVWLLAALAAALPGAGRGETARDGASARPSAGEGLGAEPPARTATDALGTGAPVPPLDSLDLFQLLGFRKGGVPSQPPPGELMLFMLPTIGSSPSVGLALGVGASAAMALGPSESTTVSSLSGSAMWTTKDQFVGGLKTVVLTPGNDWELLGDLRFYRYAEPTYGLGTAHTPVSGGFVLNGLNTAALAGGQPLRYKYLRVHETVFRRVRGNWYAGVGYHLDWHTNIVDELLDTSATPPVVTSHYAYSTVEGFSPKGYTVSAFSLNALYESRDHTLDPYRGRYLHLAYQVAPTWLGSSRASSRAYAEYRIYVPVSTRPRHLVAFWAFADAVVTGAVPYLDLPAIGYDTRGRSGRGYAAGRFRGTALVYGEVEYRFPLTRSGLLGGVAFVNATTTSRPRVELPSLGVNDPGVPLFRSVKPAGGVGLRVMADRQARMNIVLDFGFGVDGSTGVYVSVGEAF